MFRATVTLQCPSDDVQCGSSQSNWGLTRLHRDPDGVYRAVFTSDAPARVEYKYVVDGEWWLDASAPTTDNGLGGLNNYVDLRLDEGHAKDTAEGVTVSAPECAVEESEQQNDEKKSIETSEQEKRIEEEKLKKEKEEKERKQREEEKVRMEEEKKKEEERKRKEMEERLKKEKEEEEEKARKKRMEEERKQKEEEERMMREKEEERRKEAERKKEEEVPTKKAVEERKPKDAGTAKEASRTEQHPKTAPSAKRVQTEEAKAVASPRKSETTVITLKSVSAGKFLSFSGSRLVLSAEKTPHSEFTAGDKEFLDLGVSLMSFGNKFVSLGMFGEVSCSKTETTSSDYFSIVDDGLPLGQVRVKQRNAQRYLAVRGTKVVSVAKPSADAVWTLGIESGSVSRHAASKAPSFAKLLHKLGVALQ